jgi:hypothetical protein
MQTDGDTGWRRVEGSTQTRKEHNLNQQQDFDLGHKLNMADFETEICKGYGADGCMIPLDGDVIPDLSSGSR